MKIQIRTYQTEDTQAILAIINYNILHSTSLYDYTIRNYEQQKAILEDKKRNQSTRVVLMSGTPAINSPFELAILFNLLCLFAAFFWTILYANSSKTPVIASKGHGYFKYCTLLLVLVIFNSNLPI